MSRLFKDAEPFIKQIMNLILYVNHSILNPKETESLRIKLTKKFRIKIL